MVSPAGQARPVPGAGEDYPLRRLRRRRMLTQVELAGLSCSCISMIERGHRTLTRLDHINAATSALRVSPAELAPGVVPGRGERTPAPQVPVAAFPVVRDEITVTRCARLTREFMIHVARGDINATGMWLRRTVRDRDVNPWLLLDQLTAPGISAPGRRDPDATAIRRQFRTGRAG
jgi:hypothetical protein